MRLPSVNEIKLIVLDIDGVVSDGEAQPLDLDLFAQLGELNLAGRSDPKRPSVTFCTGRPAPYLEAMLQAIDGHLPGVFENGAGIYRPKGYQFMTLPNMQELLNGFAEVCSRIEETLVRNKIAYLQPGKHYSLTLFAHDPAKTSELENLTAEVLGPLSERADLVYSTSCLNVLPRGVDKGKGLAYLSEQVEIPLENMLGVGDSNVDLPFLRLVGHSAAPANANLRIKELVEYVSGEETGQGVRDILSHFRMIQ
ncbi:MAG: Cof-type HAD-IIB family hydrolase [Anaerolineae bacterium]|nr:MAG: Cof-type HAD-IIB family hydrolase [Anaerolineae bacterium]